MTDYIADKFAPPSFITLFIFFNFFVILSWILPDTYLVSGILTCLDIAIIFFYLNNYNVKQITVEDHFLAVKRTNRFGQSNLEKYSFEKMDFIYRDGPLGFRSNRLIANRGNILTLFIDNSSIFELEPEMGGGPMV